MLTFSLISEDGEIRRALLKDQKQLVLIRVFNHKTWSEASMGLLVS